MPGLPPRKIHNTPGSDIRTTDGELIKTYLSSLIDDHSRYIVQSEFYDSQRQEIVEDTFHK